MARVQFIIPDEERARFARQARREGMSLSAWLRVAARERLVRQSKTRRFESEAELAAFFAECDAECDKLEDPGVEPDWSQHLATINESRRRGISNT